MAKYPFMPALKKRTPAFSPSVVKALSDMFLARAEKAEESRIRNAKFGDLQMNIAKECACDTIQVSVHCSCGRSRLAIGGAAFNPEEVSNKAATVAREILDIIHEADELDWFNFIQTRLTEVISAERRKAEAKP